MLARTLRGVGQTLITSGVIILLFVAYELWFTGLETARAQKDLQNEIEEIWDSGGGIGAQPTATPTAPVPVPRIDVGDAVAVLRIPRLGRDYAKVVLEGVRVRDLKRGPGHYPGTQLPGQIGNFVVSGHRTTYGAPFGRLDEMQPGDPIVVETRDTWFIYRVTEKDIVSPTAIEVTYPVPREPDATPRVAMMTLTTCHPKYSARQRLIVFSTLQSAEPKRGDDLPAVLEAA